MSDSPSLDDLFDTARSDAPDPMMTGRVWERVAAVTAAPASIAVAKATPAGAKLLVVGAVIGALSTAAVGAALLLPRASTARPASQTTQRSPAPVVAASSVLAEAAPQLRRAASALPVPDCSIDPPKPRPVATTARPAAEAGGFLAKEASLLSDARLALVGGEPERALVLLKSARHLPVRALEPEGLALEARALRALGRVDEAVATELTLRARFPDHALSR